MKKVKMTQVTSSNIKSVGYDEAEKNLYVKFHSGKTYAYQRVPKDVYKALLAAESLGSYLSSHIKGMYSYNQVFS